MNATSVEIQNRIQNVMAQKTMSKIQEKSNKDGRFTTILLGICALVVSVGTFWTMFNHNPKAIVAAHPRKQVATNVKIAPPLPNFATKEEVESWIAETEMKLGDIDGKLDGLNQKLDLWAHRAWLLSLANNENANLAKRYQGEDPGYIVFDDQWKINKIPKTMRFSEDEMKSLTPHIK